MDVETTLCAYWLDGLFDDQYREGSTNKQTNKQLLILIKAR